MSQSFDLSDKRGRSPEAPPHLVVGFTFAEQSHDPILDWTRRSACRRSGTWDVCPIDNLFDPLGRLSDPSSNLVNLNSLGSQFEDAPFQWTQMLHQTPFLSWTTTSPYPYPQDAGLEKVPAPPRGYSMPGVAHKASPEVCSLINMTSLARPRPFPPTDLDLPDAVLAFFDFVQTTMVNKLAGLTEAQAASTPIPTSPRMSPLGLIKHLTAVLRQHVQIHIGGLDLPVLWDSNDHDSEWRLVQDDTIATVIARFDDECALSRQTLAGLDMGTPIIAYGNPNRVGRLLVDVLQECARHLGHMDIVRELIDGTKGE